MKTHHLALAQRMRRSGSRRRSRRWMIRRASWPPAGTSRRARLLAAYQRGIFPWYSPGQPVLWWSPDPRAVLFPEEFRLTRSLAKTLRNGGFSVAIDQDFAAIIDGCAAPRARSPGTWITAGDARGVSRAAPVGAMPTASRPGSDGELVGGLYGVRLGGVFFGESMFSRERDASKVALAHLVAVCRRSGIAVIDCQLPPGTSAAWAPAASRALQFQALLKEWVSLEPVPLTTRELQIAVPAAFVHNTRAPRR